MKSIRNFTNPKKPIRRPKQQSINWSPPTDKLKTNNKSKENLHQAANRQASNSSSSSESGKKIQARPTKKSTIEGRQAIEKIDKKHEKKCQKAMLEEYFKKKNLGTLTFKIATMGNKGKERLLKIFEDAFLKYIYIVLGFWQP